MNARLEYLQAMREMAKTESERKEFQRKIDDYFLKDKDDRR